jgi:hypothetical protein
MATMSPPAVASVELLVAGNALVAELRLGRAIALGLLMAGTSCANGVLIHSGTMWVVRLPPGAGQGRDHPLFAAAVGFAPQGALRTPEDGVGAAVRQWPLPIRPRTEQWLNLRYVTRFLSRVSADDDALALHGALVRAGKQSPLTSQSDEETVGALNGAEAVARARTALARFAQSWSISARSGR